MDNPLNSMTKLHVMSKVSGSTDKWKTTWVLHSLLDAVRSGLLLPGAITSRVLKGESGSAGLVQLWLLKHNLLEHLLTHVLGSKPFDPIVKKKMGEVYSCHETLRAHIGFPESNSGQLDLSWQASWDPSAMALGRLIENAVYEKEFDPTLKYALKTKKDLGDILDTEKFAAALTRIDELLQAELEAQASTTAQQSAELDIMEIGADEDDDMGGAGSGAGKRDSIQEHLAMQYVGDIVDVTEEGWAEMNRHKTDADRLVSMITLKAEPKTSKEILTDFVNMLPPNSDTSLMDIVIYDTASSGESITNPRSRKPPLRSHYAKTMSVLVQNYVNKDGTDPELSDNVIFAIYNAGKEGCRDQKRMTCAESS